jgi:protein SCO1
MDQTNKKFSMRKMALIVLLIGGTVSIVLQLANRTNAPPLPNALVGVVLPESRPLSPFLLTDHNNSPFDLDRLKGKWSFVFFGYTHCPDICPTALGELAEVFANVGSSNKQLLADSQGVFVGVDTKRDTPDVLKDYVPYFNPDFIGITGDEEQIKNFSKQMGAIYMVSSEKDEEGDYQLSHTSSIFLINPQGAFYALFQPSLFSPEKMTEAYLEIRRIN